MSDSPYTVKAGKLKLKGEKHKKHKKEKKRRRDHDDEERKSRKKARAAEQEDIQGPCLAVSLSLLLFWSQNLPHAVLKFAVRKIPLALCYATRQISSLRNRATVNAAPQRHGGWWSVSQFKHVTGPVVIEMRGGYIRSVDDGTFTLGAPHADGEGPDPEEVLLAIRINEDKVAFKSGYNKYVTCADSGKVTGTADAAAQKEQFSLVFQEGKLAILGPNGCFLSLKDSDDTVVCDRQRAGDDEMIKIRSNAEREEDKKEVIPDEEQGNVGQIELNYVRKFQKFQDHKIKLNQSDRRELLRAKAEGDMHEVMLDRRAKMKADRYCK